MMTACDHLPCIREKAFAKINLGLDILAKRSDGYHRLITNMFPISLADELTVRVCPTDQAPGGTPPLLKLAQFQFSFSRETMEWHVAQRINPLDNLILKAVQALFDRSRISQFKAVPPHHFTIHLDKRIPMQAGLGGGSADAAAILRLFIRWFKKAYQIDLISDLEVRDLCTRLGADVLFCYDNQPALCEGIGDVMQPIPDLPPCFGVLAQPKIGVSTKSAFQLWDVDQIVDQAHIQRIRSLQYELGVDQLRNAEVFNRFLRLQSSVFPWANRFLQKARQCGAITAQMTGSGSAFYALFSGVEQQTSFKDWCQVQKKGEEALFPVLLTFGTRLDECG